MSPDPMYNQDFYDKMIEVHTDIKHITHWIEEHKKEDDTRHEHVEGRLRTLENDRMKVIGGAGVLGMVGGFFTKWFLK